MEWLQWSGEVCTGSGKLDRDATGWEVLSAGIPGNQNQLVGGEENTELELRKSSVESRKTRAGILEYL